ncbi:hypothetical protein EJ04DRAFT_555745 [Polyplosphaeria fusca]|uniref:C2H2-type domain-containing protein n=1 Tax=Polyplosphaeria fusca TaxID=682080 RepID=A0A9P4UVH9_9PLEO|nr:hypothetical protein EJ04DRAFT_555745 [Polyplosphaeria fusca]
MDSTEDEPMSRRGKDLAAYYDTQPSLHKSKGPSAGEKGSSGEMLFVTADHPDDFRNESTMRKVREKVMSSYLEKESLRNVRKNAMSSHLEERPMRRGKKKDYRQHLKRAGDFPTENNQMSNEKARQSSIDLPKRSRRLSYDSTSAFDLPKEHKLRNRPAWTCMLSGPTIILPGALGTRCAFCMAKNPDENHLLNHRISKCAERPPDDRTFFRPDHLRQHIKNFHGTTLYDIVQAKWKREVHSSDVAPTKTSTSRHVKPDSHTIFANDMFGSRSHTSFDLAEDKFEADSAHAAKDFSSEDYFSEDMEEIQETRDRSFHRSVRGFAAGGNPAGSIGRTGFSEGDWLSAHVASTRSAFKSPIDDDMKQIAPNELELPASTRVSATEVEDLSGTESPEEDSSAELSDDSQQASSFGVTYTARSLKTRVIDKLMREAHAVFLNSSFEAVTVACHSGSGKGTAGSTQNIASDASNEAKRSNKGKRRSDDGEEQGNDDDEEGDRKRQKRVSERNSHGNSPSVRFACPYFKRHPRKHKSTPCRYPGFAGVHRMNTLYVCNRCREDFESDCELTEHQRAPVPCNINDQKRIEGLNATQVARLKSKKRFGKERTEEEKWRAVYHFLFSDDDCTLVSPYCDDFTSPQEEGELTDFEIFCRREYPRRVRQELEALWDRFAQPLEEQLRTELVSIIERSRHSLLSDFQRQRAESTPSLQGSSTAAESTLSNYRTTVDPSPPQPFDEPGNSHSTSSPSAETFDSYPVNLSHTVTTQPSIASTQPLITNTQPAEPVANHGTSLGYDQQLRPAMNPHMNYGAGTWLPESHVQNFGDSQMDRYLQHAGTSNHSANWPQMFGGSWQDQGLDYMEWTGPV